MYYYVIIKNKYKSIRKLEETELHLIFLFFYLALYFVLW